MAIPTYIEKTVLEINIPANGCWCTDIVQETRIETFVLDTGFATVTVTIDVAFHSFTINIWITDQTCRACTSGGMILPLADGIDSTWILHKARVNAFVVVTYLICSAIRVDFTFHYN